MRYRVSDGKAEAHVSDPEGGPPAGQVVVVHEVWGFTPFIRDACARLSSEGFRAVAPFLYWRDKEVFAEETIREGLKSVWGLSLEERRQPAKLEAAIKKGGASRDAASMLRTLYDGRFRGRLLQDLLSLARTLQRERPDLRLGAFGFSMGGKLALQLAGGFPGLAACVCFSSEPLLGPGLGNVHPPILLLYGSEDGFMLHNLPAFVKEAVDRGKELELKIYPSAGHEFFDHTHKKDYRAGPAEDAWDTSVDFLRRSLSPAIRKPSRG